MLKNFIEDLFEISVVYQTEPNGAGILSPQLLQEVAYTEAQLRAWIVDTGLCIPPAEGSQCPQPECRSTCLPLDSATNYLYPSLRSAAPAFVSRREDVRGQDLRRLLFDGVRERVRRLRFVLS